MMFSLWMYLFFRVSISFKNLDYSGICWRASPKGIVVSNFLKITGKWARCRSLPFFVGTNGYETSSLLLGLASFLFYLASSLLVFFFYSFLSFSFFFFIFFFLSFFFFFFLFLLTFFFFFLYLFVRWILFNSLFLILFSLYILHCLVVWCFLE